MQGNNPNYNYNDNNDNNAKNGGGSGLGQPMNNTMGQTFDSNAQGSFVPTKLSESSRLGFIRKVYAIFATQLLINIGFIFAGIQIPAFRNVLKFNILLLVLAIVINITTLCFLICSRKAARSVPINYILLLVFTVSESYLV